MHDGGVLVLPDFITTAVMCWCCQVTLDTDTAMCTHASVAKLHNNTDRAMYWCCCVTLQHLNSNVLVLPCYTLTQIQQCVGVAVLHYNTYTAMCWCCRVTLQLRNSNVLVLPCYTSTHTAMC